MIKTPHRLLHDSLSKEDYARVLVNMREDTVTSNFLKKDTAFAALSAAFFWERSSEGEHYWHSLYKRIKRND